jgi:hypothetical protein
VLSAKPAVIAARFGFQLSAQVLHDTATCRDPAALNRFVRAVRDAVGTPWVDAEQPRPAFRDARVMFHIAAGRRNAGRTTSSRLRGCEIRQNTSCQSEDEDCYFHNPLTVWRFDCSDNK